MGERGFRSQGGGRGREHRVGWREGGGESTESERGGERCNREAHVDEGTRWGVETYQ